MEIVPHTGKVCLTCHVFKPYAEYRKTHQNKDGHCGSCLICRSKYTVELAKKHKLENPEKYKADYAEWYAKNKDYHRKWRAANPEKPKEANRRQYWKDPKKNIHATLGRSAKRRGADVGSHTLSEWQGLCEKSGGRCLACNGKKKLTRDHIVPITKGGTDFISNIQPLCGSCNSRKGNRHINYRVDRLIS